MREYVLHASHGLRKLSCKSAAKVPGSAPGGGSAGRHAAAGRHGARLHRRVLGDASARCHRRAWPGPRALLVRDWLTT